MDLFASAAIAESNAAPAEVPQARFEDLRLLYKRAGNPHGMCEDRLPEDLMPYVTRFAREGLLKRQDDGWFSIGPDRILPNFWEDVGPQYLADLAKAQTLAQGYRARTDWELRFHDIPSDVSVQGRIR